VAPLREKLIRLLACLVAVDLAIAVVVIDERAGAESPTAAAPSAPAANPGAASGSAAGATGIFAGATFKHRRGSVSLATGTTVPAGSSSEVAAGMPSSTSGAPTTAGSPASTGATSGSNRSRSTGPSRGTGGSNGSPSGGPPTTPANDGSSPGGTGAPAAATGDVTYPSGDGSTYSPPATGPATGSGPTGGSPSGGGPTPTTAPGGVNPTGTPPAKGPATVTLTDKTGDVVADGTGTTMNEPRADIVKAQANWTAKALVLAVQVAQPVNPGQDPNWASQSTYMDWLLDTNGDGNADFEVQYFFDPKSGVVADVTKAGDTSGTSACGGEAGYTADGYTVAIDPACLGNPVSVSFKATSYYDPNPSNPNGSLATDTSPDGGFSGPVSKP
jgi:hypothetical protein